MPQNARRADTKAENRGFGAALPYEITAFFPVRPGPRRFGPTPGIKDKIRAFP